MTDGGNGRPLNVNGRVVYVDADPLTPLLLVLRNDLDLKAAKLGCALEQCRACKVMVDGEAVTSCTTPVELVVGRQVVTAEGSGLRLDCTRSSRRSSTSRRRNVGTAFLP